MASHSRFAALLLLLHLYARTEALYMPHMVQGLPPSYSRSATGVHMMGRKFENNKLKMAKTALAYAKKASYIGKKVVVAIKASGSADPTVNRALASVMREANALDVPKDVIDRNIKRALDPDTAAFKELTYEAYGHGGVGLIINVLSDNNNRANADVNMIIKKSGCKIAASGSVAFNFKPVGRLALKKTPTEDELLELAIEAGCEGDVQLQDPDEGRGDGEEITTVVVCESSELGLVRDALQEAEFECSGGLANDPLVTVECSGEDEEANFAAIDKLEELDDVVSIEHNMQSS